MTASSSSLTDCRRIVKDLKEDFEAAERLSAALTEYDCGSLWASDAEEASQLEKDLKLFGIHPEVDGCELTFDCDDSEEAIRSRFDPLDFDVLTDGRGQIAARILFGCGGPTYGVRKDGFSDTWRFFCCWGGESYEEPDFDDLIEGRFGELVREKARYIVSGAYSY